MSANRVDTHFHIVPEMFTHAIAAAGGDPSGWHVPAWSAESAISAMNTLGAAKGILSVTAPGPAIAGHGDAARILARDLNEETLTTVQENPKRFGWFASLPGWTDVQGTLDEIEWVFEVAEANGVVVLSSYDDM
jgi:6-methylsalicylate decarboxylase